MNQDAVTRAREKARRSHLTTVEWVQCWCSRCNGAWETPQNEKAHMKRERSWAAQIGIPASNLAGPSNAAMSPHEEPRGSPSQSNPSSSHPNSPPAPSSSHATPLLPRDQEQFDDGAYEPPTPPGRPSPACSLSNDSLHSDNFLIQHDSPGVQNLIPAAQRDDNSDGNVSDLAARAADFEIGNQAGFFADLFNRREPSAEPELELGNLLGLDGANSPDGSELGIDDNDYDLELELEPGGPGNEPDPGDNEPEFAAFNEPDEIRNAYVDAFVQKTRFGTTHEALKHQLKSAKRTISANPNILPDDLQKMAQTIRTAEKRLGISTTDIITTFPVCPICEQRYNYEYIADADSDICVNEGCAGVLFTDKILASGNRRQVPGKTYPTASLKAWLQRIVLEPRKPELLQNWRTRPDDHEPDAGPISADEWKATLNLDAPLGDITDGYVFRECHAGME
ncbi:hypothetical protein FRC07_000907 [Ceratobasidium sp. 392]|nr:hypothetical protein FRC07_000907 [Ceratobasidium sp. 392]